MKPEEITLTDDLKQPPPWKLWMKEHWGFLAVIGGLSVISFFFLVRDLFYSSPRHIETFDLDAKMENMEVWGGNRAGGTRREEPPAARRRTAEGNLLATGPAPSTSATSPHALFERAKRLFQRGETDVAIQSLLKLSRRHPDSNIREKAARLAKKYNQLQTQKRELKQKYLKAYVLFTTHPKEACGTWMEIIKNEQPSLFKDPYYRKAKKRFEEGCLLRNSQEGNPNEDSTQK